MRVFIARAIEAPGYVQNARQVQAETATAPSADEAVEQIRRELEST